MKAEPVGGFLETLHKTESFYQWPLIHCETLNCRGQFCTYLTGVSVQAFIGKVALQTISRKR